MTLPDADDEPIQVIFGYYDDWFRRDAVDFVLGATNQFADWEHEAIIAAEAVYAEHFLCPN